VRGVDGPEQDDRSDDTIGPADAQLGPRPERDEVEVGESGPLIDTTRLRAFARGRVALVVALLSLALIVFSLLWIAGEAHYRNCLYAVDVSTRGHTDGFAQFARANAPKNCSRSPF
jgi:hypothetical protein